MSDDPFDIHGLRLWLPGAYGWLRPSFRQQLFPLAFSFFYDAPPEEILVLLRLINVFKVSYILRAGGRG